MSLCLHVHTTNITSSLGRDNVIFMSFVTMSLCRYVASVNQALDCWQSSDRYLYAIVWCCGFKIIEIHCLETRERLHVLR